MFQWRHLSGQGHSQFELATFHLSATHQVLNFTLRCNSDEHVLALVEAVYGAHVDAVHDFAANTALVDDVGQLSVLSADRSDELIHGVRPRGARSLVENGRTEDLRPLAESEHRGTGIQRPRGSCS